MATDTTPKKTEYHILKKDGADTYELAAKNVAANNSDQAISIHAQKAGDQASGTYVAVPSRSFVEQTITAQTTVVVKFGAQA